MLTLAVDTTAETGSIAIADERGVREEREIEAPRGFSMVLFAEMEALLNRHRLQLSDIDLYAAASGPGSFTGARVGLAAVKGLAEVLGRRVVAVSNLEALAEFGVSNARATIIDAHRGEVYAAVYDGQGRPLVPETVLPLAKFVVDVAEWISADPQLFGPGLTGIVPAPRALAGVIARIAIRRAACGEASDPAAIEANYVRRSDAEILWKEL